MSEKTVLLAVVFVFASLIVGLFSFFHFTPWTFLAQLTVGAAVGTLGILTILVLLIRSRGRF